MQINTDVVYYTTIYPKWTFLGSFYRADHWSQKQFMSAKISPASHNTKPSSFKEACRALNNVSLLWCSLNLSVCCYLVAVNKVLAGDFSRMSIFWTLNKIASSRMEMIQPLAIKWLKLHWSSYNIAINWNVLEVLGWCYHQYSSCTVLKMKVHMQIKYTNK